VNADAPNADAPNLDASPAASPTPPPLLAAQAVVVTARGRRLLDGVTFAARPGEVVALVGANGAGKSTLLRVLAGDVRPTRGRALFDGRPVSAWESAALARRRGFLPQESTLAFPFTAAEVVLMGRAPHLGGRGERASDHAVVAEALAAVRLAGFADRLYPTLSGGERQRVQLARVLAQLAPDPAAGGAGAALPRALLLDEPVASLDLAHQHCVLALVRALARGGAAAVAVLHDLNHAAQYADRVVVLRGGRLFAEGAPAAVFTAATVREAFGAAVTVLDHPCAACPLIVSVPA